MLAIDAEMTRRFSQGLRTTSIRRIEVSVKLFKKNGAVSKTRDSTKINNEKLWLEPGGTESKVRGVWKVFKTLNILA
jgi:hypothetical protein